MFLRGKEFLAPKIKRTTVKGVGVRKVRKPESEPDFYAMAPMPMTKAAPVGPAVGSNVVVPTAFSMLARPSAQESGFRPISSARAATESGISLADSVSNAIATREIVNELNRKAALDRMTHSLSLGNHHPALLNLERSAQRDGNHRRLLLPSSSVPSASTAAAALPFQSLDLAQSLVNQRGALSNLEVSLQRHNHNRLLPSSVTLLSNTTATTTTNAQSHNFAPLVPAASLSWDDALCTALLHQMLSSGR